MKRQMALSPLALALTSVSSLAAPISGEWLTDSRDSVIKIDNCGTKMCGKIERVLDPKLPTTDIYNPDKRLRSRPIIGTLVLSNFTGSGAEWSDGRAYDPKSGKSYRSKLQLQQNGTLKVSGCIMFLCQNRYWTRVAERKQ